MYKNSNHIALVCILSSVSILPLPSLIKQLPDEIHTDVPLTVPSILKPQQLPDAIHTDTPLSLPTLFKRKPHPTGINQQTANVTSPSLNKTSKKSLSGTGITAVLATLALGYGLYYYQQQTSQDYNNLANLISSLNQKLSDQNNGLTDQQVQDLTAAIQAATNSLQEFAQNDEQLTNAYNALTLEAQKYSLI